MYKSQTEAAGAQPGAEAGASAGTGEQPAGDDKVVDADFEEVK